MRFAMAFASMGLAGLLAGCGSDSVDPGPDAPDENRPDPRVIPGGGIGDGPIDGVVNLYVIDDRTRDPIANAEVRVGTVSGTTDATGLFVADGVQGPQDVVVKAPGKRAELWVGANGANMTFNLQPANVATPASATVSGTIPGIVTADLPENLTRIAFVTYSQTNNLGDPENELEQAVVNNLPQNLCFAKTTQDTCSFTVTARTGKVALIAVILENDTKGTASEADDTNTLVGYAVRQGLTLSAGQTLASQTLVVLPAGSLQDVTVDFGTPPTALGERAAIPQVELGDEGMLPLQFLGSGATTLRAPKLSALAGATGYRLVALATDNAPVDARQSIVIRRGLAGPTLAAGTWLEPPTGVTLTRTSASWTNAAGATVHGMEYSQGSTALLNVTVVDASRTSITLPDLITLPSGELEVALQAIGADGLDVNDFALDTDRDKLNRVAGQAKTID